MLGRLGALAGFAAFFVALLLIWQAAAASAATFVNDCPSTDAACKALAERSEALVAATEANGHKLDLLHGDLTTTSGPTTVDGTVQLAADDADRAELTAWGIWFLAGVLLVLLFANLWHRAWKFWQ
jgi:hypothetical protein